jgi:hypothetical protein
MSGGGGSTTTSNTISTPPAETQPYISPYLANAAKIAKKPYENYGGKTVADLNANQNQAFGMVQDRATQGSPVTQGANTMATNTLNGNYLDPSSNPWLQKTYDAAAGDVTRNFSGSVLPGINSTFALSGRYGSGAHQTAIGNAENALGQQLGNMGTQIYGTNYNNERNNQMQTMGQSPTLASADYADAQALMGAGDAQQAHTQQSLTDAYNQWLQMQNAPYTQSDFLGNAIKASMNGGTTASKVYGSGANQTGQLVGAGLTAAGLLA